MFWGVVGYRRKNEVVINETHLTLTDLVRGEKYRVCLRMKNECWKFQKEYSCSDLISTVGLNPPKGSTKAWAGSRIGFNLSADAAKEMTY